MSQNHPITRDSAEKGFWNIGHPKFSNVHWHRTVHTPQHFNSIKMQPLIQSLDEAFDSWQLQQNGSCVLNACYTSEGLIDWRVGNPRQWGTAQNKQRQGRHTQAQASNWTFIEENRYIKDQKSIQLLDLKIRIGQEHTYWLYSPRPIKLVLDFAHIVPRICFAQIASASSSITGSKGSRRKFGLS